MDSEFNDARFELRKINLIYPDIYLTECNNTNHLILI